MKLIKIAVVAVIAGLVLVGITNQFTSTKYPSCDLVIKGIGVSTFGCSGSSSVNEPCQTLDANSLAMSECIGANYYKYKTFPFGFKQKFGPNSNLIDSKPKHQNEIATFILGFSITVIILILALLIVHKKRGKTSKSSNKE